MVGDIFFNIFIMPLELIFEFIFSLVYRWFSNPGISILALSLAMNFLVLPLYRRADAIQEEEKNKVSLMAPWVGHIKKTFKGDERYMMLKEYYRQQGYSQFRSLRGSFSLILQIPFFIAAYHYLSNLSLLNGMKFFIFSDLGAPDGLLTIGSLSINIMPIIMTAINVGSAYVYLKGFPVKDKIQTYGIAAIFLVLLYDSPSGLVFYWTLNQVFSLCKNLIMKLARRARDKRKAAKPTPGAAIVGYASEAGGNAEISPVALSIYKDKPATRRMHAEKRKAAQPTARKARARKPKVPKKELPVRIFLLGALFLTLLVGVIIPLSVVESSPIEFDTSLTTPFKIILNNVCIAAGFFIVWFGIFYYLAGRQGRRIMTYVIWVMGTGAAATYMFFGKNLGTMTNYLIFEDDFEFTVEEPIYNIITVALLAAAMIVVMRFLPRFVPAIYAILNIAALVLIVVSICNINTSLKAEKAVTADEEAESDWTDEPIIHLSTEGQNVIVLMLDRAISGYVPYMFEEKPELAQAFDGFTYYPNTLAYGGHTNFAGDAVFGGYEYTPAAMNARDTESLKDKNNEAIKVLPELFSENGFNVTVCDTPYGNYKWVSDLSIYDGMENVKAYNTIGAYADDYEYMFGDDAVKVQTRAFFMYSFMKSMPLYTQEFIYDEGNYLSTGEKVCIDDSFIDSYSVLTNLSNMTEIEETDENNILIMDNEATHAITMLSTPDYEPGVISSIVSYDDDAYVIDGVTMKMSTERQIKHYHVNMAAFLKLGDWFSYLKENGVWDNTRIIIVSDHGYGLGQFSYMKLAGKVDVEWYNSLLMVKDFGSSGELVTSDEFMTSADVPTLATEGIIDNPVNPYTGNAINSDAKSEPQLMTTSHLYSIFSNSGNTFDTSDGEWYAVSDDIFDTENWVLIETEEEETTENE